MIILKTKSFDKYSQNATGVDILYNECIKLIDQIKTLKIKINTGSSGPSVSTGWKCLADEAKEANNEQTLMALKKVFEEAISKSSTGKNINFQSLSSSKDLMSHISQLGNRRKN